MSLVPKKGDRKKSIVPAVLDMSIEEFRDVYPTWLQWRATEKKFLPSDLRRQPQKLMDGVLYLDSLYEKIEDQIKKQTEGK